MANSLAIVGVGSANISALSALIEKVRELEKFSPEPDSIPVKRIYLIDHEGNHGAGKAWGRHAHPSMLFSDTSSNGAVDGIKEWLRDKENVWLPEAEKHRHGALKTWFEHNQPALDAKEYGKIYLPRFVRGMFQQEKLHDILQDLPESLEVVILDGKVAENKKTDHGYRLEFKEPAKEVILKKDSTGIVRVVPKIGGKQYKHLDVDANLIGVGASEPKPFPKVKDNQDYFANPTELHPHLEGDNFADQFKKAVLKKHHELGHKVEVGVLGAGLSFLDMVNLIYNDDELRQAINLTSISSSGFARTEAEGQESKQRDFAPESQMALNKLQPKFIAARVKDAEPSKAGGITIKTSDEHLDQPDYKFKAGTRSDKKEHHFDIVIQTLGFGKWQEQGVFKGGVEDGTYKADAEYPSPAVDRKMRMAAGSYVNGMVVEPRISGGLKDRGIENQGFLNNVHRHGLHLADSLFDELYDESAQRVREESGHRQISRKPSIAKFAQPELLESARSV